MQKRLAIAVALLRLKLRVHRVSLATSILFGLLLPACLYALTELGASPHGVSPRRLLGLCVAGMSVVAVRTVSHIVRDERVNGELALIHTTQVSRSLSIGSNAAVAGALGLCPLGLAAAVVARSPELAPVSALESVALYCLLLAALSALGGWIGGACDSAESISLLTYAALIPTLVLSPLLYPKEQVPELLAPVIAAVPTSLGMDLIESAWVTGTFSIAQLTALAAWTAFLSAMAWRAFRWEPEWT